MGHAKAQLLRAGTIVELDFSKPDLLILKPDREILSRTDDGSFLNPVARVVRLTITAIITAAFPQGMDRHDGKLWAAWIETLDEGTTPEGRDASIVSVSWAQVEWLRKHLSNEDVKIQSAMAQWREAVVDYFDTLTTTD